MGRQRSDEEPALAEQEAHQFQLGGAPAASTAQGTVLALQMLAGNAAVTRLVTGTSSPPDAPPPLVVQRQDASVGDEPDAGAGPYDASLPGGVGTEAVPDDASGSGAGAAAGTASPNRPLPFITMKRKHIHLTGPDKYGHWWTEMDGSESYGWWPKYHVGVIDTLLGVEGELNGVTTYGGSPTLDPHHGDAGEEEFHPVLTNSKSDATVRSEVRSFAHGYSGEWRWTFGWGQNCHTFQESMMASIGLVER